jgi:glucosyl-dolichyl phosphate glucuronosyltransferase
MKISIVVCTYNRSQVLRGCLDSLLHQTVENSLFEVIIVDNNSPDDTQKVVAPYVEHYPHFRYILETEIGLSRARNTGFQQAQTGWILYLDDDVKVLPNLVESALNTIDNYDFDCFGGIIYTFYLKERPRWIKPDFLSNQSLLDTYKTPSLVASEREIWGCLLAFKKDLLQKFGGFKPDLGMNGNKMGYFEETDMLLNFKDGGYRMGIDPNMRLYHLIPDFKLNLSWHLKECFVSGRDVYRYWSETIPTGKINFLYYLLKRLLIYPRFFFNALKRWISEDDFYYQNMMIQTFRPILFDLGIIMRKYQNDIN